MSFPSLPDPPGRADIAAPNDLDFTLKGEIDGIENLPKRHGISEPLDLFDRSLSISLFRFLCFYLIERSRRTTRRKRDRRNFQIVEILRNSSRPQSHDRPRIIISGF